MLTSSNQIVDIKAAYDDGANGFLTKPDSYSEFKLLLKTAMNFWLNYNLTVHDS